MRAAARTPEAPLKAPGKGPEAPLKAPGKSRARRTRRSRRSGSQGNNLYTSDKSTLVLTLGDPQLVHFASLSALLLPPGPPSLAFLTSAGRLGAGRAYA